MWNELILKKFVEKELKGIPLLGLSQINRVKENALMISKELKFDFQVFETSLMLYNIGIKQFLDFNQNLLQTSLNISKNFLEKNFFPSEKIDKVLHCIQESGLNGKPETIEAKILHDANLLDSIGEIGILKDSFFLLKNKKNKQQILGFFISKKSLLPNAFFTLKGKELSEKEILSFNAFVDGLKEKF